MTDVERLKDEISEADAAYDAGYRAFYDGRRITTNPYEDAPRNLRWGCWREGWRNAEEDLRAEEEYILRNLGYTDNLGEQ